MTTYNVYCDESCHLQNDGQKVMVLGAIWCPTEKVKDISGEIRAIKSKHNLSPAMEIKWTKVSPGQQAFYLDLVSYFFKERNLHFRALIVPDKTRLKHDQFGQDHDTWYYKMYFDMLKAIPTPKDRYRIYLDIKDTRSAAKVNKLHEVLSNNMYDFDKELVEKVQQIRSHESELLQLTDLLIGAVSYTNRGLTDSSAKLAVIDYIRERSKYSLLKTTLLRENKMNIFVWQAEE